MDKGIVFSTNGARTTRHPYEKEKKNPDTDLPNTRHEN